MQITSLDIGNSSFMQVIKGRVTVHLLKFSLDGAALHNRAGAICYHRYT